MRDTALFLFFLLIIFSLYPCVRADDSILPVERGKIAVVISFENKTEGIEYNNANLAACLKNHLDYILWYNGWDYDITDTGLSNESIINLGCRYRLDLKVKASFKSLKIQAVNGGKNKKGNYTGLLSAKLALSFFDLKEDNRPILENHKVSGKSRTKWVRLPDGEYMSSDRTIPEPPDFVIKRLLSRALDFLPSYKPRHLNLKGDIPVYVLLDKHITATWQEFEKSDVYLSLLYTSRSLQRQFGFGLKISGYDEMTVGGITFDDIQRLFDRQLKPVSRRPDTLTVAIFDPINPERFYSRVAPSRIGLSDLGRQVSLMARLLPPDNETSDWGALINGQLILHEIGHLFGAVHVSDLKSIMNPYTTWVSSDRFDPLNFGIVKQCRRGNLPVKSVAAYLTLVADRIDQSGYGLADYPPFFFSYVNLNQYKLRDSDYGGTDVGRAIPYAAIGYRMYLLKDYAAARDFFYKALACAPTQAAIHYYLSKTTSGKLSEVHLNKSAAMGFYRALHDIEKSHQDFFFDIK